MRMIGELEVSLQTDRAVVMTRSFDAPRSVVFEAWTRAEHVAQWWDPSGAPLAVCEIDLRPGGEFRWVNRGVPGSEHSFAGVYREIVAPEKLVFAVHRLPSPAGSVGTLVFTEQHNRTTLTMTIECESAADRDALIEMRVDAGTAQTLANLAAYLPRIVGQRCP